MFLNALGGRFACFFCFFYYLIKTLPSDITDKSAISPDDKFSGIRGASDDVAHRLILNTYKTLLTRGQKGCYVYCENEGLRGYLKKIIC